MSQKIACVRLRIVNLSNWEEYGIIEFATYFDTDSKQYDGRNSEKNSPITPSTERIWDYRRCDKIGFSWLLYASTSPGFLVWNNFLDYTPHILSRPGVQSWNVYFKQTTQLILIQVILEPSLRNINIKQSSYLGETKDRYSFTFPNFKMCFRTHDSILLCLQQWIWWRNSATVSCAGGWNQACVRLYSSHIESQWKRALGSNYLEGKSDWYYLNWQ